MYAAWEGDRGPFPASVTSLWGGGGVGVREREKRREKEVLFLSSTCSVPYQPLFFDLMVFLVSLFSPSLSLLALSL